MKTKTIILIRFNPMDEFKIEVNENQKDTIAYLQKQDANYLEIRDIQGKKYLIAPEKMRGAITTVFEVSA